MQSSARNQFAGKVAAIRHGVVTDEIDIETPQGARIVATITHSSTQHMSLREGSAVIALVKAPAVTVVTDAQNYQFSARNQIHGTVSHVVTGSINTEVQISSPHDLSVVAIVTNSSAESLGLRPGVAATALFKASAVLLAVSTS